MTIKITALYERLLAEHDSEQGELEGRIGEIKNNIAEYEKNTVRTDKFMEVVRKSEPITQEESADKPTGKKKTKVSAVKYSTQGFKCEI